MIKFSVVDSFLLTYSWRYSNFEWGLVERGPNKFFALKRGA